MELKELIAVFRKGRLFFAAVLLFSLAAAFFWQRSQPTSEQAILLLNIGRSGMEQNNSYYTYDSFYRLQADERFADTVVRWLSSPRVVSDIYTEARLSPEQLGIKDLKKVFAAARLSSQMIEVSYTGTNEKNLKQLADATVTVLGRYTKELNQEKNETDWFVVIGSDPVIRDARVTLTLALAVGLAVGLFVGFWSVLFRHYLSKE